MSLKEIKFSDDQKKINFHFANGSTSPTFYSKEASLKCLFDYNLNGKIDSIDYDRIRNEIISAKNMPICESDHERVYHLILPLRDAGLISEEEYTKMKQRMKKIKL